jgi:branched-chain amino acid transport system ATP-binding protein
MQALRIISEDHSNMWRLATTIDHVAGEIEDGAQVDPAFFNAVFDYIAQYVDRFHHPKEDDYLFRLLRLRSAQAAAILDALQQEHRDGPQQLMALRAAVAQAAQGALAAPELVATLRAYTAGLKNHMRQEEKLVMPLAREALTQEDWAEIDRAFLDHKDPLFGDKAKAEFRELFHRIASLALSPNSGSWLSRKAPSISAQSSGARASRASGITSVSSWRIWFLSPAV